MNRQNSKLKPIAPKPPAQAGSSQAGSSSSAAGNPASNADGSGGRSAGGSGPIVPVTPGQHHSLQQHPGQHAGPIPTAAPYPGGPQPAFPGPGPPPYALPFPVGANPPQPAYMMHPAGASVSGHPGAPIVYPAGPQPVLPPSSNGPAASSSQDYVWGTPADEAGGGRTSTPPPLQLTAGAAQSSSPTAAPGQIIPQQPFPVSSGPAPGVKYPGMVMSYFPGQVSPVPVPMPLTMQYGQQGPTIYQHGTPGPNQFIQTSVAPLQPQPHVMALPAPSPSTPSKKTLKKQQKAQAQLAASVQPSGQATAAAHPANSGSVKPASQTSSLAHQAASGKPLHQINKQHNASSSHLTFDQEIDLDETLKNILESEDGVRAIAAPDALKQGNDQQETGSSKASPLSDESANTVIGGSPLDGMKEDVGYGLTATNDVDASLEDIYGMQTSGFSGLNEEDLDLDFVTLEVDMGDCTDITGTSPLGVGTHPPLKKAKSMAIISKTQPADESILSNLPTENAISAVIGFLKKARLPDQERNAAVKAMQALKRAAESDSADPRKIAGSKKRSAAAATA